MFCMLLVFVGLFWCMLVFCWLLMVFDGFWSCWDCFLFGLRYPAELGISFDSTHYVSKVHISILMLWLGSTLWGPDFRQLHSLTGVGSSLAGGSGYRIIEKETQRHGNTKTQ